MIAQNIIDITPLQRNPTFLRLWIGTSLQALGSQFSAFAVLYQMWELTHSPLMTGVVGLTLAFPMIVFGFWGGVLADTRDRRGLVMLASFGAVIFALALCVQTIMQNNSPALLLCIAAAQAGCVSLGLPARKALIPDVLPRKQLGAGIALSHASFQVAMLAGPALAGLIAGLWGVAVCYALEAVAFAIALYGLSGLPKAPPPRPSEGSFKRLLAGFQTIWRRPSLRGSLLTDLAAMLLAMPVALLPALNEARFDGTPETLGLFFSAIALGGIVASLLSGTFTPIQRQGIIQLVAAFFWGLSLAIAGLAQSGWLILGCFAIAGAADTVAVIARGVVVQLSCEPHMRGRVLAAEQIVGVAAPEVGNFRAGAMASFLAPGAVLTTGGLLCVLAVIGVAVSHKQLVRFRLM